MDLKRGTTSLVFQVVVYPSSINLDTKAPWLMKNCRPTALGRALTDRKPDGAGRDTAREFIDNESGCIANQYRNRYG